MFDCLSSIVYRHTANECTDAFLKQGTATVCRPKQVELGTVERWDLLEMRQPAFLSLSHSCPTRGATNASKPFQFDQHANRALVVTSQPDDW